MMNVDGVFGAVKEKWMVRLELAVCGRDLIHRFALGAYCERETINHSGAKRQAATGRNEAQGWII